MISMATYVSIDTEYPDISLTLHSNPTTVRVTRYTTNITFKLTQGHRQ